MPNSIALTYAHILYCKKCHGFHNTKDCKR